MGWWTQGDDLLGDGPVDVLEDGLRDHVAGNPRPTWQEFLDAADAALVWGAGEWLSDPGAYRHCRLRFNADPPAAGLTSDAARGGRPLTDALAETLARIAAEYQEHRGRKPTLSEVLGTISFSLGVHPERFVSVSDRDPPLSRVVAETIP